MAWWGITPEQMQRISAPALFIVGDRDAITVEHTVAMSRAVRNGQLAVFPGTAPWPDMTSRADWPPATAPASLDPPEPTRRPIP